MSNSLLRMLKSHVQVVCKSVIYHLRFLNKRKLKVKLKTFLPPKTQTREMLAQPIVHLWRGVYGYHLRFCGEVYMATTCGFVARCIWLYTTCGFVARCIWLPPAVLWRGVYGYHLRFCGEVYMATTCGFVYNYARCIWLPPAVLWRGVYGLYTTWRRL